MATYTENYNLTMPEEKDCYNVEDFNENFETIDVLMAETENGINEVNAKIGTTNDSETNSVFSKLNDIQNAVRKDVNFIKSIQYVTYTKPNSTDSGTIQINKINPEKCIVILERLHDASNITGKMVYSLNATSIDVSHNSNANTLIVGFWIIEFN